MHSRHGAERVVDVSKPCLSCGVPTDAGSRCTDCAPTGRAPDRRVGRERPSRPAAWRRLSERARRAQPWCSECGATDDLTVDHVVPVALGGPMLPGPEGLRVLCKPCNSRKGTSTPDDDPGGGTPDPQGGAHPGVSREGDYSPGAGAP